MTAKRAARSIVRRPFYAVMVAWILCQTAWPVSASAGDVRPLQQRGRTLLAKGIDGSTTFKQLIDKIAHSDVVVYVDLDAFDERKVDGSLRFLGKGGGTRFLKVWLRPRRIDDEMVVTLGHELQHALEVAGDPQVVSQATFAAFYARKGQSDKPGRFETRAAQQVARRIRVELGRLRRGAEGVAGPMHTTSGRSAASVTKT
jgi:hypothetical protein